MNGLCLILLIAWLSQVALSFATRLIIKFSVILGLSSLDAKCFYVCPADGGGGGGGGGLDEDTPSESVGSQSFALCEFRIEAGLRAVHI